MERRQPFRLNVPNAITLARFGLVPIFMVFLLIPSRWSVMVAIAIFAAASLSDVIDGYIARSSAQVTTFGKFADPLADKLLVTAAWLTFIQQGRLGAAVVMVLIGREFLVTGLRILAMAQRTVIPASVLGKLKTASHIALVLVILSGDYWGWGPAGTALEDSLVALAVVLSLASGAEYFYRCRRLFLNLG